MAEGGPRSVQIGRRQIGQHSQHNFAQLRQVDVHDLPPTAIVDMLVFMPQDIADADDRGSWGDRIFACQLGRQRPCSFRDDLYGALRNATQRVAFPVFVKTHARHRGRYAVNFVADVKQPDMRALRGGRQKILIASLSMSLRIYGERPSRVE